MARCFLYLEHICVLNKLFNTDFLALDKKIQAFLKGLKLVV